VLEKKNCQHRILYPGKIFFRNKGGIKTFSDEEELIDFVDSRPILKG
jgi:hypothetical protein